MNWIEKELIEKKIERINQDFYELGKEFNNLKENKKLDYESIKKEYGFSKNKVEEYIENYKFIKENNIKNYKKLGIKKINLLKKVENKEKIKELVSKEKLTEEEIKKEIKDIKYRRIKKKCFSLNEEEEIIFENIKLKLEKEFGNKLTNSQVFSYIITYFELNY